MVMFLALHPVAFIFFFNLSEFARASSHVADLNTRNELLTQKLLKQGYRYHKLRKARKKAKIRNQKRFRNFFLNVIADTMN